MPPAADGRSSPGAGSSGGTDSSLDRHAAYVGRALGSPLRLTVRLREPAGPRELAAADAAWATVRAEFEAVDVALSKFRGDSELTALNRRAGSGASVRVSRRLRVALAAADRAGRLTGGRFDARLLTALERIGEHGASLDATGEPSEDVPGLDASAGERRFLVTAPAMPIDLGGIGKGLALRWAAAAACASAPRLPPDAGFLLEAGGDVVAAGSPPAGGWLVGIEDPVGVPPLPAADDGREPQAASPIAVVALAQGAVATSSVRVRRWTAPDGTPVHHLLDPTTGEPARRGLIAVTVAAPDPAWAEVWSKALFLAGRAAIGDEARERGIAAWWVDAEGRLGMTPDARVRCAWVAEERIG